MMGKRDEGDPYKKGKAFPLSSEEREQIHLTSQTPEDVMLS